MSNLEYIAQARKLLTEDYKTKHTNEYNSWLSNHQNSWMQPHVIVPFPPFIVSSALAPFKSSVSSPSEDAVVAKALELYKQFNPTPPAETTPVIVETIVEQSIDESVMEQPITELLVEEIVAEEKVEQPIVEPEATLNQPLDKVTEPEVTELTWKFPEVVTTVVEEPLKNTDAIYKIFQEPSTEVPTSMPVIDTTLPTIETALNVVPQPAEELAKVKNLGGIFPSVLDKLQAMKAKWSTTGEKNV